MPDLQYDEATFSAVAKAALLELTPEATVGDLTGHIEEDGAITVTFAARMAGYPGWHWTVSVAQVEDSEPTALEVELMPGNGALLAPDWLPWSERLAEYQAAQGLLEAAATDDEADDDESDEDESDDDDDLDSDDEESDDDESDDEDSDDDDSDGDDDDDDDDDDDPLGSDVLHGGDLDGVDIDDLDEDELDDESDDDESDDDDPDAEDERTY